MANTIKSYVILRNDTATRWAAASTILKKGEIALSLDNGVYSIKVGNGTDTWSDLPFVTANSKDVSSWAKEANKPQYSASDIIGLSEFINTTVVNSNTTYKIEALARESGDTETKYQLYKHDISDEDDNWTAVVGSVIIIPDSNGTSSNYTFTGDPGTNIVTKDTLTGTASSLLEGVTVGDSEGTVTVNKDGLKVHDIGSNTEYNITLPSTGGRLALYSEIVTANKATQTSDGLLSKEDKVKLDSYTAEDIQKWKNGYDKLQAIETSISAIDFENTDETSLTQLATAVLSIINAFKTSD